MCWDHICKGLKYLLEPDKYGFSSSFWDQKFTVSQVVAGKRGANGLKKMLESEMSSVSYSCSDFRYAGSQVVAWTTDIP